jgi:CubicO group peptidase (beta-lactamase class C family)
MPTHLQEDVQRIIDRFIAEGDEVGLQVAAYVDGKLAIDAWAGVADEASGRPVDGETLFTSWSTTKGFVATCVHILADRGKLDYDEPISTWWPEFAANGKETATDRHALTHSIGVPQMPEGVTPEMMTNWDAMCAAIATLPPLWKPGTKTGYHSWTFGWINGEIIRRVDGRPIAQFAREELCDPLGIEDFYLGIPDEVEPRVATLRQAEDHRAFFESLTGLPAQSMPLDVSTAAVVNRPDIRRASIPGGGGIMNARAIARHYAVLAGHGELDGVRILSPERIDIIRALQTDANDEMFQTRERKGLGYFLGGPEAEGSSAITGPNGGEFGHAGNGGSHGFADPERRLAFGLTKNLLRSGAMTQETVAFQIAEAIRAELRQSFASGAETARWQQKVGGD